VAGRAGILVDPTLLVYALIGWSWTDGGFQLDSGLGASGNLNGPTIGGGIEKLFHQNWSARFEYRFIDFGSLSTGLVDCDWGCTKEATAHITDQSVRLVLTYRP
jgi:outer membrane immunogenic protein